jgi:hypothetical protein
MHHSKLRSFRSASLLSLMAALGFVTACSTGDTGNNGLNSLPQNSSGTGNAAAGTGGTTGGSAGAEAAGTAGIVSNGGGKPTTTIPTMQAGSAGMPAMNCGAESHQAMIKPLAIYLLVDWSASMTESVDLWTPVKTALTTFVSDTSSAGLEVGLSYFPVSSTDLTVKCDATQYATPSVEVAMLPEAATPVTASLDSKMFTLSSPPAMMGEPPVMGMLPEDRLSTPTAAALTGSLQYFSTWLAAHPDHIGVVVLATDGEPAGCDPQSLAAGTAVVRGTPEELEASVAAITTAASGTPAIKTYVIGVEAPASSGGPGGPGGGLGNLQQALSQLAAAGDTGKDVFMVGAGTDIQAEFLEAMKEIRGAALPCSFEIPLPTVGILDHNKVNVDFQPDPAAMTTVPFTKVDSAAACGDNAAAWHYDDPANPTSIELCPAACTAARDAEMSNVSISLGCETRVL